MPESNADTIRLKVTPDGSLVRLRPDGSTEPYVMPEPDLDRLDRLSDDQLTAAAHADPDNPPLGDEALERLASASRVKRVRRHLGLSQEAFAERFRIPVASLRDWEQGRRRPDAATQAYLTVIDHDPQAVLRALAAE